MAATQPFCDICDHRHVTKPSTVWCLECEQAFCDDCNEYHGFSRLSQNHVTVSIQDHLSMSPSISQISHMCMEHNEQYQMFCQVHEEPICPKCIEKHDGCKGIVPLSKVIENVKKSSLFQETQQSLKDINGNIKTLQSELNKQTKNIKEQEETILSKISDTKNKINDHLDILEKKIRKEISEITAKLNNDMNQTLHVLESKNNNINNAEQQLKDLGRFATDLQTYFGLRNISSEAATTESYLQSIIGDNYLDETTLLFNIDEKIDNTTNIIQTFGSVKVHKAPCQINLVTKKTKQAQLVGTKIKSITDIKLRLIKTIKTGVSCMKGIVSLPSGNIALSDYSKTPGEVVIFGTDGEKLSKVTVKPAKSFDITFIDDRTLASTSPLHSLTGVCIIDIEKKKISKYIPTNYQNYGIKHHDGSLFVCASKEGIFKINPQDGRSTAIVRSALPSWSYIDIFYNKIYYTNDYTESVTCCHMNGKAVWIFKDENILKCPRGLAVDNSGNVYVACSTLHRVVVISPDGQQNRQLLSREDGLESPCAIHFDRKNNCLLVVNSSNMFFIYEVIN
ncbi:uncharacterized protein LOC127706348 [Mytilus californianus]|uniref:uncharacterized protein LOC127706348 n=1 Tax=Mytilus californianus TaxID=6549 RepID=UPI0022458496|nr:uncharacterized protein LOC127706348 [Mytilus californianus]